MEKFREDFQDIYFSAKKTHLPHVDIIIFPFLNRFREKMENAVIGPSPINPVHKTLGNTNESLAQSHQRKFTESVIIAALTQS